MNILKTVALAALAVGTTSGVALATASSNGPAEPGHTLPTVANSHAQQHAGPVLARHTHEPKGHAYGRGHGRGKPAGVTAGNGKSDDTDTDSGTRGGPPFDVPPAHGRPSSTPPVSTSAHPKGHSHRGRPTAIPSHSHP